MNKIRRNFILGLILITISLLFTTLVFASSGTYTSESIGEADVTSFKTLEVIDQNKPEGADIKYSFAGSKDNYAAWSQETTIDQTFDLSGVEELRGGGYLKVKINMVSSSDKSPSLKGFKVTYVKGGGNIVTTTSSVSTSGTTGAASSSSASSSESTTSTAKLVSTGGSLWFNILIALVITGLIAFFVLRQKKPKEPQKTQTQPSTQITPLK